MVMKLVIEESFTDFIKTNENTGLGIATDILQKLEVDLILKIVADKGK